MRQEPEARARQAEIGRALEAIRALRRRAGTMTTDEPLAAKHEGRSG
ncbi:hypothetical protein AiwAL_07345 [Acidiphilium sp. AL]|uniref:Uncharacterized protein n=1 Tax=Acidiphilium iwatense TaxID=768198 RepID=A0ABS9DVU9_9PROT|nr:MULTISPECIES: hypothetical protein [Acidiphilium]MCF3946295.1 hypothetical protein [Acidiphilium iwatense]MCU4159920.1 hypothetical protein [Acidiphilium sp. AL]